MEDLGVVRAMKDAGIELRFGRDEGIGSGLGVGMRPYFPGNLHGLEHLQYYPPAENFYLED